MSEDDAMVLTKLRFFREYLVKDGLDPEVTLSQTLDYLLWEACHTRIGFMEYERYEQLKEQTNNGEEREDG